jgi:NitT/TauT family transport system substrate-binding protein
MTSENKKSYLSRRAFLGASAVGLGAAAIGGSDGFVRKAFAQSTSSSPRVIKLAWGQTAVCQSPISVALKKGLFEKYGLTVEPVNFSGPTDQLLQAIATGKADGGIGMALRWLKPLEQGFDVSLTVGTHGGCMRLLAAPDSGINSIADLKGKKVAVSDQASPIRNFFAIQAAKQKCRLWLAMIRTPSSSASVMASRKSRPILMGSMSTPPAVCWVCAEVWFVMSRKLRAPCRVQS